MDYSLPGSSVHGILQARILEWVAIPFSEDLPDSGTEPGSPALQADSLPSEPPRKPIIGHEHPQFRKQENGGICPDLVLTHPDQLKEAKENVSRATNRQ